MGKQLVFSGLSITAAKTILACREFWEEVKELDPDVIFNYLPPKPSVNFFGAAPLPPDSKALRDW